MRGSLLARALGISKPSAHKRALAEGWQVRRIGNRFEYRLPLEVGGQVDEADRLRFSQVTHSEASRALALMREQAVLAALERGEQRAVAEVREKCPGVHVSVRSLQRWRIQYQLHGLDGLVDQRRGRTGRPSAVSELEPAELERFANRGKARALEHGSISKAVQLAAADRDLPAALRSVIHGSHTSKSYVTPSVRNALRVSDLAVALEQGARHARLQGRYTPCQYGDVRAGEWFVSDDMTSNVICWCEWPNARGWRIGQPQILPVQDVGSLRWLNVRVIMRESGQYAADDVWGLFGDVFDTFGMPARGFVLEGGIWAGNTVKGQRTGLSDHDRIGGLRSLGLQISRSFDPRSKIIEGQFNQFQGWMDACPGWAGREQRYDQPERLKEIYRKLKNGEAHPRQFFLHVSAFADHTAGWFTNMNQMRQDGQVLRGLSPLEKWSEDGPRLSALPDEAKWMYRSAMNVVQVTRNGVRVTQGSGRNLVVYYYDAPWLVPHQGQKVVCYWNDHHPEADAMLLDAKTRTFLGAAQYVKPLGRFNATEAELDTEAERKRAAMAYARTELRAIQPEMQRHRVLTQVDAPAVDMGGRIREAAERVEAEETQRRQLAAEVRRARPTVDDLAAVIGRGAAPAAEEEEVSMTEISALLAGD